MRAPRRRSTGGDLENWGCAQSIRSKRLPGRDRDATDRACPEPALCCANAHLRVKKVSRSAGRGSVSPATHRAAWAPSRPSPERVCVCVCVCVWPDDEARMQSFSAPTKPPYSPNPTKDALVVAKWIGVVCVVFCYVLYRYLT